MENSAHAVLAAWTYRHGVLMMAGLAAVVAGAPMTTIAALAALSFGVLTYEFRTGWTPSGAYGWANLITACRFLLVGLLLWYGLRMPLLAVGLAIAVLLLDGIDGWQARRSGSSSAYGSCLDREVDAFFTLALCLVLYHSDRFGPWILIPGAMRYVFVVFIHVAAPPMKQERATRWSRASGALALGSLIACLLPLGVWGVWIGGIATAVVVASFSRSFWRLYQD
ncbi:MAG: CDP-alcohol phosphatidyltransferase family protein [Methylotetracoccus sp.]|nr:CDP-alcohol phosphatidyltransferase family protein [Methylotetracoccus sp.]